MKLSTQHIPLLLKTKKKTYVLLALVIAIWGTIAFKIVSALNPEIPELQQQSYVVNSSFKVDTKIDTFSIKTVNRDPFLGTLLKKESKKTIKKKKPIQWKSISYHGSIKKNKAEQIFIITINGKQHVLKKGQTKDSITLTYGNKKSVTLRYKNQSKSFTLKK